MLVDISLKDLKLQYFINDILQENIYLIYYFIKNEVHTAAKDMQVSLIQTAIPLFSMGPFSFGFSESMAKPCFGYPERYANEIYVFVYAYIFVYDHILFFCGKKQIHRGFSIFETSRARLYFEYLSFVHFISFCFIIFPKLHIASSQNKA